MKKLLNLVCLFAFAALLPGVATAAEDSSGLADQKAKISYAVGMNIGSNLKRGGYDIDVDVLAGANPPVMPDADDPLTLEQGEVDLQSLPIFVVLV